MNDADRKLLTKKMGELWHKEISDTDFPFECECGDPGCCNRSNRSFTTPDDYFALWNWAKGQEWWINFIRTKTLIDPRPIDQIMEEEGMCRRVGLNDLIDPIRFPELVVQFGKEVLGWT